MDEAGLDTTERQEEETGLTQVAHTLFPAPPTAFARFSRDNVARYRVLDAARTQDEHDGTFDWAQADPKSRIARQTSVLERADAEQKRSDDADGEASNTKAAALLPAPTWDVLLEMDPPRVDWIEEQGHYTCFGEQWPVNETLPSLEEMGMTRIYPVNADGKPADRSATLKTLLRTMLKTYLGLVDMILAPPHEYVATERDPATGQVVNEEWRFTTQDASKQINDLSINFMHLLNESRPLQAREQLRDLMQEQLDRRRQETDLIRRQCQAMRSEIASLRHKLQSTGFDRIS